MDGWTLDEKRRLLAWHRQLPRELRPARVQDGLLDLHLAPTARPRPAPGRGARIDVVHALGPRTEEPAAGGSSTVHAFERPVLHALIGVKCCQRRVHERLERRARDCLFTAPRREESLVREAGSDHREEAWLFEKVAADEPHSVSRDEGLAADAVAGFLQTAMSCTQS